jgi:hypothetical protein
MLIIYILMPHNPSIYSISSLDCLIVLCLSNPENISCLLKYFNFGTLY